MSRKFFDTNIFLSRFEGWEPFRSQILAIRRRMIERGDQTIPSAMTLGEIMVRPTRLGQASPIQQYDQAIRSTTHPIRFDAQVAWRFATLRAAHPLPPADAIQLACAATFGVDLFLTNDERLHTLNIPGIGFITPIYKVPL